MGPYSNLIIVAQIQELVEAIVLPMTHKERFQKLGVRPPKGVLLYGPPGTGKTLMARACAAQTNATFLKLAGPQLVQVYYKLLPYIFLRTHFSIFFYFIQSFVRCLIFGCGQILIGSHDFEMPIISYKMFFFFSISYLIFFNIMFYFIHVDLLVT